MNLLTTWIPALFFALLGSLKLAGNRRVVKELTELGVGRYVRMLSVMEVAFAALFVIPATFKLGFILESCYQAGATARSFSEQNDTGNQATSTRRKKYIEQR